MYSRVRAACTRTRMYVTVKSHQTQYRHNACSQTTSGQDKLWHGQDGFYLAPQALPLARFLLKLLFIISFDH